MIEKTEQNSLQEAIHIQLYRKKGQIKYKNLSEKQIWKFMGLDKYLNYRSSLRAYL